ncbi:MAG: cation:proton antiporter [Acidobacteria bacterium]|nr:cation:proton antiporter [Acidobacteriota bacterium]
MHELELWLGMIATAVLLAAAARKVGAPYPVFLAIGGALLALIPGVPSFSLPPDLALALFIAPVLLDAAFDASPRDLRANWATLTSLVVVAVGLTTIAVALVLRYLLPDIPLAAAIALGAVVAPPDAAAATAVLRPLQPPHRILTILEGESLLNDASSLLIFRLAVSAALAGSFSITAVAPAFLISVLGSLLVGPLIGYCAIRVFAPIEHVPTSIILQFVSTLAVWIFAEHAGLSGVLTMVSYAMTLARSSPLVIPARMRVPTYAVWETVVFLVNILAFIFIGLQLRPILMSLPAEKLWPYLTISLAVLATVILVRLAWHLTFDTLLAPGNAVRCRKGKGGRAGRALIVAWSGMRGILTLAAAMALPPEFPYRELMLLTAFAVVVGTLVLQGLTLGPLLCFLKLDDDDLVGQEASKAREKILAAALATFADDQTEPAGILRQDLTRVLSPERGRNSSDSNLLHTPLRRNALGAARRELTALRSARLIGDDALHIVEEDLDWMEMADRGEQPA